MKSRQAGVNVTRRVHDGASRNGALGSLRQVPCSAQPERQPARAVPHALQATARTQISGAETPRPSRLRSCNRAARTVCPPGAGLRPPDNVAPSAPFSARPRPGPCTRWIDRYGLRPENVAACSPLSLIDRRRAAHGPLRANRPRRSPCCGRPIRQQRVTASGSQSSTAQRSGWRIRRAAPRLSVHELVADLVDVKGELGIGGRLSTRLV